MKNKNCWRPYGAFGISFLILVAITLVSGILPLSAGEKSKMSTMFDAGGQLIRPEGYREWIQVGTPLTPNDMNGGKAPFPEFHSVYIDPKSYAEYKKTGKFPDGTTLVKELISVGSKKAESGNGYFMGEFIGLEVSIKDSKRFAKEPGNWAFFSFGHSYPLAEKSAAQPTTACNVCHQTGGGQDWVFIQYYPVLRAAKMK